jgi:hypothetical protein
MSATVPVSMPVSTVLPLGGVERQLPGTFLVVIRSELNPPGPA